jgi:hypothetical protein
MAINQNTKWPNRNTLYLGRSGSGKSQQCKQNAEIPRSGARVLLWDLSHDHKAFHIDSKVTFANQVKAALKSGKPFRLAFSGGDGSIEDFEWFCSVVWAALDGNHETFCIVEELSAVCGSVARASPNAAKLLNQGRKYGLRFHGVAQKSEDVSKTFYDQTEVFYIGAQRGDRAKKCAKLLSLKPLQVELLENLEFWRLDPKLNGGNPELIKIQYQPNNY